MTAPSPEDAVQIARTNAAAGRGISVAITIGVLAAVDADRARIAELEAAIASNEQHSIGYQAGYAAGEQDANATHAANPTPPAQAPPRQAPNRAQRIVQRIENNVIPTAFPMRKPHDLPGEATGDLVVKLQRLQSAMAQRTDTEPAPPAPTR